MATNDNITPAETPPPARPGGRFGAGIGLLIGLVFAGWLAERADWLSHDGQTKLRSGEPVEIVGPTLDGGQLDVADYRGRFVLVDCWATWCGPCIGEIPNVRAIYEQYHPQGLEVVGVSLDFDRSALVRYVETNKLPWPQIFYDPSAGRGIENPIAAKYGIDVIPCLFLIGRDGKLLAQDLRGDDLRAEVARAFGESVPGSNQVASGLRRLPRWLTVGVTRAPWWLLVPCGLAMAFAGAAVERAIRRRR